MAGAFALVFLLLGLIWQNLGCQLVISSDGPDEMWKKECSSEKDLYVLVVDPVITEATVFLPSGYIQTVSA